MRTVIDDNHTIYIVNKAPAGTGPAEFGAGELSRVLSERGVGIRLIPHWSAAGSAPCLVIGTTASRHAVSLLERQQADIPRKPESFVYQWCDYGGQPVLVVAGSDERGLMYALLELAERIEAGGAEALNRTADERAEPDHAVRGLDRYIMGPHDDEWFYSADFWHYYFRRLAYGRFNRFVLITGWDTSHFSPPYPFFVDVPGFADMSVAGFSADDRARNRDTLRLIGDLCRRYGLDFFFGIWQQKPWTGSQEVLLQGIPEDELAFSQYCAAGLQAMIAAFPQIDGLQFRVNMESGIGKFHDTNDNFWNTCIRAIADADRKVKLDLRAKGATDEMIAYAVSTGLDVSVPTKFWCEHLGLPYHPTELRHEEMADIANPNSSRRYSYGDMLKQPRGYDVLYRLWNYGSATLFLWGDPDYARRFADSCRLGGATGFEISAPLGLKGGHATIQKRMAPWTVFKEPDQPHCWEDERYWLWYKLFGRLGYDAGASREVWMRELEARFGPEAADDVVRLYTLAGKILPLITAFHMPVHPSLCYWPELSTGGALFAEHNYTKDYNYNSKVQKNVTYTDAEPSDPGLFYRISDYIDDRLKGEQRNKYTPLQVRDWLQSLADGIGQAAGRLDALPQLATHKEWRSSAHDFAMLATLAEYHARKIAAALEFRLYTSLGGAAHLERSLEFMRDAREKWARLAELGGKFQDSLVFNAGAGSGLGRSGHWRDRLAEIDADIARLEQLAGEQAAATAEAGAPASSAAGRPDAAAAVEYDRPARWVASAGWRIDVPAECRSGVDLEVALRAGTDGKLPDSAVLHYRRTDQTEGAFRSLPMVRAADGLRGSVPGDYITPGLDLMFYCSAQGEDGEPVLYPGIYHPEHAFPYFVVRVRPQ